MGQRSQIYIRYNVNYVSGSKTCNPTTSNFHGLIARYYQWNFGERMISRARGIIEAIKEEYMEYGFLWGESHSIEKLRRLCDVNFDMRDIVMSDDILAEVAEYWGGDTSYIFNQDNNDGQLLIDVTDNGIKYCFIDGTGDTTPMDGDAYMRWQVNDEDNLDADWRVPVKHRPKSVINYTDKNIKKIGKMARLMTKAEVEEFVNADYSAYIPIKEESNEG